MESFVEYGLQKGGSVLLRGALTVAESKLRKVNVIVYNEVGHTQWLPSMQSRACRNKRTLIL